MNRRDFIRSVADVDPEIVRIMEKSRKGLSEQMARIRYKPYDDNTQVRELVLLCADGKKRPISQTNQQGRVTYELTGVMPQE